MAPSLAEGMVIMEALPPFIGSDHGDLWMFKAIDAHGVESFHALEFEYFDSRGNKLKAIIDKFAVSLELDSAVDPEPERLKELIRSYFERVRTHDGDEPLDKFSIALTEVSSLSDCIRALQRYLDDGQSSSFYGRLFRKSR